MYYEYVYIYNIHGQDGVVPGEVRFDWAESVFYAFWDVGGLAEWLTRDDTFQNTKA